MVLISNSVASMTRSCGVGCPRSPPNRRSLTTSAWIRLAASPPPSCAPSRTASGFLHVRWLLVRRRSGCSSRGQARVRRTHDGVGWLYEASAPVNRLRALSQTLLKDQPFRAELRERDSHVWVLRLESD